MYTPYLLIFIKLLITDYYVITLHFTIVKLLHFAHVHHHIIQLGFLLHPRGMWVFPVLMLIIAYMVLDSVSLCIDCWFLANIIFPSIMWLPSIIIHTFIFYCGCIPHHSNVQITYKFYTRLPIWFLKWVWIITLFVLWITCVHCCQSSPVFLYKSG